MNPILLLDNYDSFTYNLKHLIEKSGEVSVVVVKNDQIHLSELSRYSKLVLSPGPGLPSEAGQMPEVLKACPPEMPILGVCLGLQAIGLHFGARLKNLNRVVHGRASPIRVLEPSNLFAGCPEVFHAGRYHSWVIDEQSLPPELVITSVDEEGCIMSLRHQSRPVCGVQFHPESILSDCGEKIIGNWLNS